MFQTPQSPPLFILGFILLFVNSINGQAFTLCASGHVTPNKYMAGKTTYFKKQLVPHTTFYQSYTHPPESPSTTYIYEDFSSNTSCWSFGITSDPWNIMNENYDQFCTLLLYFILFDDHCIAFIE